MLVWCINALLYSQMSTVNPVQVFGSDRQTDNMHVFLLVAKAPAPLTTEPIARPHHTLGGLPDCGGDVIHGSYLRLRLNCFMRSKLALIRAFASASVTFGIAWISCETCSA